MKNRIMLVDDSITIHRVIDLSLESDRFEVEKAFTYEDAINKIKKFNPGVVLLDNKLEGVNVASFVKELKSTYGARVILLVGAFDDFDESKLMQYGCDDFLVKPFSSQSLEDKLVNLLPQNENEDIVVSPVEEKDAAVEELMSKISEDVGFDELAKEPKENEIFEETDLKIDLDEPVLEVDKTVSGDVKSEKNEELQLEDIEKTEEDNVEDIFSGLEELDASALLKDENKESEELLSIEDIEKDITSVKLDKSDILEDLILDNINSGVDEVKDGSPESEEVLTKEETVLKDEELKLEEAIDIKIPDVLDEENYSGAIIETPLKSDSDLLKQDLELEQPKGVDDDTSPKTSEPELSAQYPTINDEKIKSIISEIINEDFVKSVIKDVLAKSLEKAVWEIVPELAERLILSEIEKIKSMDK
ncbi:response regulator [Calditerrivibrio sp.]|jgi:DNA-binding response OmpR family regulator|uniref:response regulator n=1 Tax=Calditerrivibrio sp. TaxID=2792612 RepID=UPI003D14B4CB